MRWSGADLGAGIADFDVYVSTNAGPWNLWIAATSTNSAGFLGEHGSTYAFYSIARDHVGHLELPPASADASNTVLLPPPFAISIEIVDDAEPDGPAIRVTYPVESDFDYYLEFRAQLDGEAAWQVLPDAPHNTGALTLPVADAPQFFRVQRTSR